MIVTIKSIKRYNETQNHILVDNCKNSEAVVVKVIRIHEINDLLPFYQDPEIDLKVILLVRSPVTMLDSRLRLWKKYKQLGWGGDSDTIEDHYNILKHDCDRSVKSKVSFDKDELIRQNTLIIRYKLYRTTIKFHTDKLIQLDTKIWR